MPEAWRIVRARHAATAFSGEGAAKVGGRWNSRGVTVVYTSATRALAVLETLVHLNPPMVFQYKIIRLEFPDALIERITVSKLATDWRTEPPPPAGRQLGDAWVKEGRSAILALPSVIIPEEINYLLNPAHPDFKNISIGKAADFIFDPRLA